MTQEPETTVILTISCRDTIGIVAAISGFLAQRQCNILESAQFFDRDTGMFFMRVAFMRPAALTVAEIGRQFEGTGEQFGMDWHFHDRALKPRVLILVSKQDHCAADLLYRRQHGELDMVVPAIASNHPDLEPLAVRHEVPFVHLPVTRETRADQERRLLDMVKETRADFVVLARYMQILSEALCSTLRGRAVNIHHSFLPGFKGAKPYHQAYTRGVKLIGATAHYVTPDLDEGPIIEQVVERVDHTYRPEHLVAAGRDSECTALSRAVKYLIDRRVFLNRDKTVIFR